VRFEPDAPPPHAPSMSSRDRHTAPGEQERWDAVDRYIADRLLGDDAVLAHALERSAAAGLPQIAVSPPQGKLLYLLARIHRARRVLELGTLGGYSTIWLARALPADGRLVTIEADPDYARVAEHNIASAGLSELVDVRVGPALERLPELADEGPEPFDLVFIDADKQNTPHYFQWALSLTRPGGVIVTDNVVLGGAIVDPDTDDGRAVAMREFHELLAREPRVSATTIQTVGVKHYDGFTVALVEPDG
jgi:predicted O-methyltransferase YrrM